MSRRTSMRIIYNFLGVKTLDCMCEERFMCLIRNCGASYVELIRLLQTLCTAKLDVQSTCFKYAVHTNMSVGMIQSRIALFCRDSAAIAVQSVFLLFFFFISQHMFIPCFIPCMYMQVK